MVRDRVEELRQALVRVVTFSGRRKSWSKRANRPLTKERRDRARARRLALKGLAEAAATDPQVSALNLGKPGN